MKRGSWMVGVLLAMSGCATARRETGPGVDVYEADAQAAAASRRLPEGCRLLGTSGPIDQMESERIQDPYKRQRQEVAQKGGNVLLVLSRRTVTRPGLDCPSGDTSPDCLRGAQSWYRVSFEEYECSAQAAAELKRLPAAEHTGGLTIPLWRPKQAPASPAAAAVAPVELKSQVESMMKHGVSTDVILAYVKGQRLSRKLTASEIIEWTKAGIPDAIVEAAASR